MVNVPVLAEVLGLGETEKLTVPLPVARALEVIMIQELLLMDVLGHSEEPVATTLPEPPEEGKDWEVGEIENEQAGGALYTTSLE